MVLLKKRMHKEASHCPQRLGTTIMLMLGMTMKDLPSIDFFAGVSEPANGSIDILWASQIESLTGLRSMTGGVACLQGPAGTGRTFTPIAMAPHCMKSLSSGCLNPHFSEPLRVTPPSSRTCFGCPILELAHGQKTVDPQTKVLDVALSRIIQTIFLQASHQSRLYKYQPRRHLLHEQAADLSRVALVWSGPYI
ncbi:hypothetical protein KVT40_007490 [Elsinoe batatas]|uniref:Uncharacterized protein n=1 Tax=Elsinoe batatas TaxID=2601811 RepID=A0A8K0KXH8_9PEZI|nr:hypothetical protein KVT40_007490 [Elsinoe batatas]